MHRARSYAPRTRADRGSGRRLGATYRSRKRSASQISSSSPSATSRVRPRCRARRRRAGAPRRRPRCTPSTAAPSVVPVRRSAGDDLADVGREQLQRNAAALASRRAEGVDLDLVGAGDHEVALKGLEIGTHQLPDQRCPVLSLHLDRGHSRQEHLDEAVVAGEHTGVLVLEAVVEGGQ